MTTSLIYSDIRLYRTVMNVLYAGRYRRRFTDILTLIGDDVGSVCDVCFGDTIIADACRDRGIMWTGVDLNAAFCARARQRGHHAIEGDLLSAELPPADVFVMAGSLYHFHDRLPAVLDAVWRHSNRFILSEPVRNLSSSGGLLGWWAKRSANPGNEHATFRYDRSTLLEALRREQARQPFTLREISSGRDMLVELDRRTPASSSRRGVC